MFTTLLFTLPSLAASYEWESVAWSQRYEDTQDLVLDLIGSIMDESWNGIASANAQMLCYPDNESLRFSQYDRKTTWVGDDNVTFVLTLYGELLSLDTIESATKVPLCSWGSHEHSGGVTIEDPTDFYLGFMTPESKTADGIPRYGWYHLSIDDDLNDITLLDSGVGLYGESVYVGIGTIPEPSSGLLVLMGFAVLSLKRKFGGGDRQEIEAKMNGDKLTVFNLGSSKFLVERGLPHSN